jgi:hypothetical protein
MDFETLYRELENSTEMIRALLLGISQEDAQVKPSPESWSILEVTCHLFDEEREDFREHLDFILHRQNEEWHSIDPQGWVTERNYSQRNFVEIQQKFFAERKQSLDWLTEIANSDWKKTYTTQFRTISAEEMFASWVAHDNLHIRQLVELRRARIERIATPHSIEYAGDW